MKKSKLLIPALSIASVGAVVAPMVTSCNESVYMSTNNNEFVGTTHDAVAEADKWTLDKGTEEYFKDKKYLAEDFLTAYAEEYGAQEEKDLKAAGHTNVSVSINIKINSLTLGDKKTAKVTVYGIEAEHTGYLFSAKVSLTQNVSYDKKLSETEATEFTKIHEEESMTYDMTLSNCFVFLGLGTSATVWYVYLYGAKDASNEWTKSYNSSSSSKSVYTLKDNTTYTENSDGSANGNYGGVSGTSDQSVLPGGTTSDMTSNYLSKVNH